MKRRNNRGLLLLLGTAAAWLAAVAIPAYAENANGVSDAEIVLGQSIYTSGALA